MFKCFIDLKTLHIRRMQRPLECSTVACHFQPSDCSPQDRSTCRVIEISSSLVLAAMAEEDAGYVSAEDDDYRPELDLEEKAEAARDKAEVDNSGALRIHEAMLVREVRARIAALGPVVDKLNSEATSDVLAAMPLRWLRKRRRTSKGCVHPSQQGGSSSHTLAADRWCLSFLDPLRLPAQTRQAKRSMRAVVSAVRHAPPPEAGPLRPNVAADALLQSLGASSGSSAAGAVDGMTRARLGLPLERRGRLARPRAAAQAGRPDLHGALVSAALSHRQADADSAVARAAVPGLPPSSLRPSASGAARATRSGAPSSAALRAARTAAAVVGQSSALVAKQVVFAGELKTIHVAVDAVSGARPKARKTGAVGGLAAAAASLEEPERVSTLAASSADWEAKKRQEGFAEDVERFAKDGFVSRQNFLQHATEAQAAAAKTVRDQGTRQRRRLANKEFERRMGASANKE